jgi:CRISPR-associated protein Cas6
MTDGHTAGDVAMDAVFPVEGLSLPRDHSEALQQTLCAHLPWLATDALAGVHAIKLVAGREDPALLSGRARLLLRLEVRRWNELLALANRDLKVAGHALRLGVPHRRELQPHGTLYAYKVAAASMDEIAFMAAVERELDALEIGGQRVCGKHQHMRADGAVLDTFSLMLHGLAPAQSLRLQAHGLGPHRLLGCGIFVPHKSAAAA